MKVTTLINTAATVTALQFAFAAHAFDYSNGDVLLIFRSVGLNDIEFNIGNIGQFLGHTNGYTTTVSNWDPDVVNASYPLTGGNVQFALVATTGLTDPSPGSWVSDAQPLLAVTDVNFSKWSSGLAGQINSVGTGGATDPLAPANVNYDVLVPASKYAFDYINSNNGNAPGEIPYLGGASGIKFQVTGSVPGAVLFYEISPSSATPKPPGTLVGSFSIDANGTLTYQAGPLLDAALITGVSNSAGLVAVTFNSRAAVKYRLRYSTDLTQPLGTWTIAPNSVTGNGGSQVLFDATATDEARFYVVESYP